MYYAIHGMCQSKHYKQLVRIPSNYGNFQTLLMYAVYYLKKHIYCNNNSRIPYIVMKIQIWCKMQTTSTLYTSILSYIERDDTLSVWEYKYFRIMQLTLMFIMHVRSSWVLNNSMTLNLQKFKKILCIDFTC